MQFKQNALRIIFVQRLAVSLRRSGKHGFIGKGPMRYLDEQVQQIVQMLRIIQPVNPIVYMSQRFFAPFRS